ncbi:MAG: hypothetical protein ACJ71T_06975 [Actinomycetales bacterium]|jgi:hypothetical protein
MSDEQRPEGSEGRGPLDVEAAFADIVAHWDDTSRTPIGSWPAQEDIPPIIIGDDLTDDTEELPDVASRGAVSSYDVPLVPTDWAPRLEEPAEEPDGFVPPEPPPLPRGDLVGWLAWTAVIGGPLFLLLASQVWTDIGRIWIMLAVLAFIGGFAAIVARLPNSRNEDDPDDGAVV